MRKRGVADKDDAERIVCGSDRAKPAAKRVEEE